VVELSQKHLCVQLADPEAATLYESGNFASEHLAVAVEVKTIKRFVRIESRNALKFQSNSLSLQLYFEMGPDHCSELYLRVCEETVVSFEQLGPVVGGPQVKMLLVVGVVGQPHGFEFFKS
jgi:hypothetical protein